LFKRSRGQEHRNPQWRLEIARLETATRPGSLIFILAGTSQNEFFSLSKKIKKFGREENMNEYTTEQTQQESERLGPTSPLIPRKGSRNRILN
jgi:hypothetical protein